MGNPRILRVHLGLYGYHMEVDISKDACNREAPHWHLCHGELRFGQISVDGHWVQIPNIGTAIRHQAEEHTRAYRQEIIETYNHNRSFGID